MGLHSVGEGIAQHSLELLAVGSSILVSVTDKENWNPSLIFRSVRFCKKGEVAKMEATLGI